jgi:hypothetical protein
MDGFKEVVKKAWSTPCCDTNHVGIWQQKIRNVNRNIKGWSKNIEAVVKKKKANILSEMDLIDMIAEHQQLSGSEREKRKEKREKRKILVC